METWNTQDFQLAVAVFTLGHRLIEIDSSNPRRAIFRFESDSSIDEHAELFFANNLTFDIRTVLVNFRTLKDRLYAGV